MKRLIVITIVAAALAAMLAGTALAQGPANPQGGRNAPATCPMGDQSGFGMRGGRMMGAGHGMPAWAGMPDEVEKLLDMTEDEIQSERLAGKSLAEIALAKGVAEETLVKTILDAKQAQLTALVADEKLTQAQADLMFKNMQTQVPEMVNRTTTGPAWSSGGRMGGGQNLGPRGGMQDGGMQRGGRWNR